VFETLAEPDLYGFRRRKIAGDTDVAEIAVSTDGGQTWAGAEFMDPVRRHAWRRWKFDWLTPKKPGQYTLLARAKDTRGAIQPDKHDQNYGVYVINHSLPIEVFVSASPGRHGCGSP
jgi:hypothetical protein